jgi:pimeloyl-ACP methyl ester carboxylesterase
VNLEVDGKRVFAYTAAHELQAGKPTIVFVHGAGLDHSSFGLQSRYFGYHGWNVVALDLPGHGRSEGPAFSAVGDMADWLARLLKRLDIQKACIVGHSMGALVALEFAARHPAAAERIACLGVAFPMRVSAEFLDAARNDDYAAFDMDTIWAHAPQVPFARNPNPGMWMYGDTLARLERLGPGVLYAGLKACNDYAAGLESAARIQCPVLAVLGRRDAMAPPRAAQALLEKLPRAKVVTIEASGHSLMAEAPDATLDALVDFTGGKA